VAFTVDAVYAVVDDDPQAMLVTVKGDVVLITVGYHTVPDVPTVVVPLVVGIVIFSIFFPLLFLL
jgi:hypothetical protein